MFFVYGGGELKVEGYIDSDFMSNIDDRKSNFGHVFILNGGVINWRSGKNS